MTDKILVLCTGNSCRSIIAEALIKHLCADRYQVFSAGSAPVGEVHPMALKTLQKNNVPIDGLYSKSWDEFDGQDFAKVITVCDSAADTPCPIFSHANEHVHWGLEDPAYVEGEDSQIHAFDEVYNALTSLIKEQLMAA